MQKSNFGNDDSAGRGLSRFGRGESPRLDEKEADEMASQGGYEDSKVEGHDREHD